MKDYSALERYEAPEMDEIRIETEHQVLGGSTQDPEPGEDF